MFKKFKTLAMVAFTLAAFSQPAMAREFADIYEECGLGALIAPHNPAVAAVTNVTWDSGTTAITSNISSPSTCQGGQEKTAAFINDSYEFLENDLASGNGTYLDTLMVLAGVDAQSRQQFSKTLRADFAELVSRTDYSSLNRFEKAGALYNLVFKNG